MKSKLERKHVEEIKGCTFNPKINKKIPIYDEAHNYKGYDRFLMRQFHGKILNKIKKVF